MSEAHAIWLARGMAAPVEQDLSPVSPVEQGFRRVPRAEQVAQGFSPVSPVEQGFSPAFPNLESAILKAVVYASLFDYPLTAGQVAAALVGARATDREVLRAFRASAWLRGRVDYREGYFFLPGREGLIERRRLREAASRLLLERHRRVLRLIGLVPCTRLVALSGSVAHLNADPDGDIDLFIVTRGRRAWFVTLAIVALTRLAGCRRTFCANYVISDEALAVDQPDLFSANQIAYLRPIADDGTFARFVEANAFVRRFYPGFTPSAPLAGFAPGRLGRALKRAVEAALWPGPGRALEEASRWIYGSHLRRKAAGWRSPEQVRLEPDRLKLHGHSHRRTVLDRFEAAVAECASAPQVGQDFSPAHPRA